MQDAIFHPRLFNRELAQALLLVVCLVPSLLWNRGHAAETSAPQQSAADSSDDSLERLPWTLRPYRVEVVVSFGSQAAWPDVVRKRWLAELQELLESRYAGLWDLTVREDANAGSVADLPEADSAAGAEQWKNSSCDKGFRGVIEPRGGAMRLAVQEWDRSTQTVGNRLRQNVEDQRRVPFALASLISDAFRPLVQLDVVSPDHLECLIRAGEYPTRYSEDQQVRTGDILIPALRYLDRDQSLRKIQSIPWTWLQVTTVDRARASLVMHSAFRAPLPAVRRRVELVALRVRPQLPETEVILFPRGQRQEPLAGVRCEVRPLVSDDEEQPADPEVLVTDRQGRIRIATPAGDPVRMLQVRSGEAVLARVPIVLGVFPVLNLEVPNDAARLRVEGEVDLLEGELVQIVATREVLIARAQGAADQKRWDDVDHFLLQLRRLPTPEEFLARVNRLELQGVHAAQQAGDRVAESRVKRLCKSIRESAERYLEPERIRDFLLDINSQRTSE